MTSTLRFDFNLALDSYGWADPVLEGFGQRVEMTASYLADALGDLLGALMTTVNGRRSTVCNWARDPGEWLWLLDRIDDEQVHLEITGLTEDRFRAHFIGKGDLHLDAVLPLVDLVEAVTSGVRRCLEEVGAEEFSRRWRRHPFPMLQLTALERWASSGEPAPIYESDADD